MEFIETPVFTKEIERHLDHEEYRALQLSLLLRPRQGALLQGGGGLRKLRWRGGSRGKRGGLRIIYYWIGAEDVIYFLYAYSKSRQKDLTRDQLEALRYLVKEELQ